jgi:hypothetical protein
MKWTDEAANKIRTALSERGALGQGCPTCGKPDQWSMADAFYFLVAQDELPNIQIAGRGAPCAALVCTNCGNTQLINLLTLGLGADLTGIKLIPK